MQKIPIYQSEISVAGLADKIQAQSSVAFINPLEPATEDIQEAIVKSIASLGETNPIAARASQNDSDLYYTKSILVSTCWNKNTDVFDPKQTWAARHTPSHKPTNLEHDETKLVGHMVDCYAIDADGSLIADNTTTDNLPDKFHLVTGAVIYKNWESEELMDRTVALIEQIEAGQKFVSMEVLFTDFDYAVITPDGKHSTKARDESTAFLTKHLCAYGGTGEYDGYKVGRLLKNLTFCGKGYVGKPANPESVIFSAGTDFTFTSASEKLEVSEEAGVSNHIEEDVSSDINFHKEENNMSEQLFKDQATKAEAEVVDLKKQLVEANKKVADADVAQYTSQIEELNTQRNAVSARLETANTELEQKSTELDKVKAELESEKTAKAELETKMEEIKAAETTANRVSTLVDGGIEKESATETVATFTNLDEEQFTVVATELIKASKVQTSAVFPPKKDEDKEEDKDKKQKKDKEKASDETDDNEDNADATILDEAVENKADTSLANDDTKATEDDDTSENLSKVIASFLRGGKTTDEGDK